jgi:hypothetical protein
MPQDVFHLIFENQLVELDLLLFHFVLLGEHGLVTQLLEPPLVLLVLFVQAAELVIGLEELLFEQIVAVRHDVSLLLPEREMIVAGPIGQALWG